MYKGKEVIVRDGAPVTRIVPMPDEALVPREGSFGSGKDKLLYMADDFDAP